MAFNDEELTNNEDQTTPPTGQAAADDSASRSSKSEQTPSKVNLFKLPEFQDYQRQINQTFENERRANQQRQFALEQQLIRVEESGLDDFEKTQRENQRLREQLKYTQQAEQQRLAQQAEQTKVWEDLQVISEEFGIPTTQLFDAPTYKEALRRGREYFKEQLKTSEKQQEEKRAAHLPDMGSGKAPGASSRLEADLAKAETAVEFARILRQAGRGNARP